MLRHRPRETPQEEEPRGPAPARIQTSSCDQRRRLRWRRRPAPGDGFVALPEVLGCRDGAVPPLLELQGGSAHVSFEHLRKLGVDRLPSGHDCQSVFCGSAAFTPAAPALRGGDQPPSRTGCAWLPSCPPPLFHPKQLRRHLRALCSRTPSVPPFCPLHGGGSAVRSRAAAPALKLDVCPEDFSIRTGSGCLPLPGTRVPAAGLYICYKRLQRILTAAVMACRAQAPDK